VITPLAIILILNGVFNVAVWPTFFRRVARDPRARIDGKPSSFLIVHAVIVSIALVLAAVSIVVGALSLIGIW